MHGTSKCRYLIWNTGSLSRAAGKDTPLFITQGLSERDALPKEWSRAREFVWVDCGGWRDRHQLTELREGAHITLRWPLLSLKIFKLGVKVLFFFHNLPVLCALLYSTPVSCSREWFGSVIHSSRTDAKVPPPLKVVLRFGMNGDVALWWCLFCVSGVKWQPCGDD